MNKKHKILFSICAIFIGIFSFFTGLAPLFTYADSSSTYNVSFVAPDNSLLYDVSVSSGNSLVDIQNSNIITNSYFGDSSFLPTNNVLNGWYVSQNPNYQINSSIPYLTLNSSLSSGTKYLIYDIDTSLYRGQTLTFSACLNGNIFSTSWSVPSSGTGGSSGYSTGLGINMRFYIYGNNRLGLTFDILSGFVGSVNIYWTKCEVNNSFTGYFSQQYLNNLLSSYNLGNYYYTYDVDFSSPITGNKYYYPKQNFYTSDTWYAKSWQGVSNLNGRDIFVIGSSNVYYSNQTFGNYVLDLSTSTWNPMSWGGLTSFNGRNVWTDGYDYYYSYNGNQYVLDVSTSTWTPKTWTGLAAFSGQNVWTDGSNYYYSSASSQYILNVQTSTWTTKTWIGLTNFIGNNIWTDGTNYYYSYSSSQYVLNSSTSTWTTKTWYNLDNYDGENVWKFNDNIYFSGSIYQYVLNYSNTSDYYYENGYNQGYANGFVNGDYSGYNRGYSNGVEEAGNFTFFSLIGSLIDAPIQYISSLFNWNLLGVNLWSFFTGLLTLALIIFIVKLLLGGK